MQIYLMTRTHPPLSLFPSLTLSLSFSVFDFVLTILRRSVVHCLNQGDDSCAPGSARSTGATAARAV